MTETVVQMDDDLYQRLDKVARDLEREKSGLIHEAVERFVIIMEQKNQMHAETLEALASVERGEFHDGDETLAWMDSWFTENELPEPKRHR